MADASGLLATGTVRYGTIRSFGGIRWELWEYGTVRTGTSRLEPTSTAMLLTSTYPWDRLLCLALRWLFQSHRHFSAQTQGLPL